MKNRLFFALISFIIFNCASDRKWNELNFKNISLFKIVFGNNKFLALGREEIDTLVQIWAVESMDGKNWNKYSIVSGDLTEYNYEFHLRFINNQFIFWSESDESSKIFLSQDGINWTILISTRHGFSDIAWDGHQYIAVGVRNDPLTSTDLINWTERGGLEDYQDTTRSIYKIVHNDSFNQWIGIGRGYTFSFFTSYPKYLFFSSDGISWEQKNLSNEPANIDYLNNQFFMIGPGSSISTSKNGKEWIDRNIFFGPSFINLAYANGEYIAIAQQETCCTIWSSADLSEWKTYNYEPTKNIFKNKNASLRDIASNSKDFFVIVGSKPVGEDQNNSNSYTGVILTSP